MTKSPDEKPPFKPPSSFGLARRPESRPLDLDSLLAAGTELAMSAERYALRACGLFRRLDELARANRANLGDADVLEVLAEARAEAEGWLERGFHAFDGVQQALTRMVRFEPGFGAGRVRRDFNARRRGYFLILGQIAGRVFANMYGAVLNAPTCGELSAIPPWVYIDEPGVAMRQRYDRRYDICHVAGHMEAREYWRRRNVRAVESGALEGVVTRIGPSEEGGGSTNGDADDSTAADQQLIVEPGSRKKSGARRRASGKRKRDAADTGTPWSKRTRPFVLRVKAEEGQDMSPLTNEELAQLPWNADLPSMPADDPRKMVEPHQSSAWWDMDRFPHLMAWSRLEKPPVDFGWDSDGDDSDSDGGSSSGGLGSGGTGSGGPGSGEPGSGGPGSGGPGSGEPGSGGPGSRGPGSRGPRSRGPRSTGQGSSHPSNLNSARRHGPGPPSTAASHAPSSLQPPGEGPRATAQDSDDHQTLGDLLRKQVYKRTLEDLASEDDDDDDDVDDDPKTDDEWLRMTSQEPYQKRGAPDREDDYSRKHWRI